MLLTGFITGFCNGLFGSGGGTIAVPAMVHILGMEEHESHATALSVIMPLALISSTVYLKNDLLHWDIIWRVALGGVVGGVIGAYILDWVSTYWLRKIFACFMIAAAVRMFF